MREEAFYELTAVWPCAYETYRCEIQNNTQSNVVIDGREQVAFRQQMRDGQFLLIDDKPVPVVFDDGIAEDNHADNAAIGITCFASNIYLIAEAAFGGALPLTYLEYFDFQAFNGFQQPMNPQTFWSDGGKYFWTHKQNVNTCEQWIMDIMPRVIVLAPHLCAVIQHVQYCPLLHTQDPISGNDYFVNDGVQSRAAGKLYSDWNPTTPA
jgi:hypothetical protein